ncbi:MAG TPA: hypothetical protein VM901_10115 [Bdellovibrionota bacterium]|jgi:hypothetical protein|nr:hypothetical protein [Bdellovibrionota bacterium]
MREGLVQRWLLLLGIGGAVIAEASNVQRHPHEANSECVPLLVATTHGGDALLNAVLDGLASRHLDTLHRAIALLPNLDVKSMNPDRRQRTLAVLVPALRRLATDDSLSDAVLEPVWASLYDFGDF